MLPSPLARASSWDPWVARDAGALLGTEARVQGFTGVLGGVAELIRDPRWGRSFETLGEDPLLNGRLVAAEVKGVQSRKVVGTLKHYAANNQETGRQRHNVDVDERTLRELHLLPYEIAVPASGAPERDVRLQPAQRPLVVRERLPAQRRAEGRARLQGAGAVRLGRHPQHRCRRARRARRGATRRQVLLAAVGGRRPRGPGADVAARRHGPAQAARADRGRRPR